MTADNYFEQLGYKKRIDNTDNVVYEKEASLEIKISPKSFKRFITYKDEKGNWITKELPIETNELSAALDKAEEKGW